MTVFVDFMPCTYLLVPILEVRALCCRLPSREKIQQYTQRLSAEAEEKQMQLARKVAQATFEQMEDQIKADVEHLRSQRPSQADADQETALDMKYVRDRQRNLGAMIVFFLVFFGGN